jgi:hypothetical protein
MERQIAFVENLSNTISMPTVIFEAHQTDGQAGDVIPTYFTFNL